MSAINQYLYPNDITELLTLGPMPPVTDPYPIYKKLRNESPVYDTRDVLGETSIAGNPYSVLITRYDDVKAVLKDDATFASAVVNRTMGIVLGPTIIGMDDKEHLKHRALVTPSLAIRSLRGGSFPEEVRKIANHYIDQFIEADKVDLHSKFCFDYPISVFVSILGLPIEDVGKVHRWGQDLCLVGVDPVTGIAASDELLKYLTPIVKDKRKHPGDDMVSMLVQATIDGQELSDIEVISFLRLLTLAGAETTNHLLGTAIAVLLRDPDLMARVRDDRTLVPALLSESMRWESPVSTVLREATCATSIGGTPIKQDTAVVCHIGSANRDERHFENPDIFDIDRPDNDPIPFGYGPHYCAGSHLAKLEAEIGINALLDRMSEIKTQPGEEIHIIGYSFRGPDRLPITFRRS